VAEAATAEEYERAFARFKSEGVNGVVLLADSSNIELADRISELALETRLPTACQLRETARAGGLMSYGARNTDQFRMAAFYVDRILRGQKPAELPVQQPTMFEFVINLKTAKVLGVTVPDTLIALADEVVE
jgi:putative ABC transport system substrate-binding protein